MENTTTRLAIGITNHPPFHFSWDDNTPQRARNGLKEDDILPTEEDGRHLHQHMMDFMLRFLVNESVRPSPVSPTSRTPYSQGIRSVANEASLSR